MTDTKGFCHQGAENMHQGSSPDDDFARICDFANLYTAHMKARLGKRHKAEVIRFELDLGQKLTLLSRMIKQGTYLPLQYYHFQVYEPKKRDIHALRYPDRVVQRCLCDQVLRPVLEPRLIYDNAACRRGKGTHFSMDRLSRFLSDHYRQHGSAGYYLKCDISKYFDSIDHDVLKVRLKRLPFSDHMLEFLGGIIDSFESSPGCGLPLGNQSSQWFALYYLDEVDRLIKEKLGIKHYVRYMDDFILIHNDKDILADAWKQIDQLLTERLKLSLNSKTRLAPLRTGINYLGFRFLLTDTGKVVKRLLPAVKKRMNKALRLIRMSLLDGGMLPEEAEAKLASFAGHLRYGDCGRLAQRLEFDFVD